MVHIHNSMSTHQYFTFQVQLIIMMRHRLTMLYNEIILKLWNTSSPSHSHQLVCYFG